ncbi:MAG: DUF1697 domain-containing protein [Candidatus Lutacidiplasmatales archaeon]
MPVYIALLRAVNVGGGAQVKMEALRALLSRMGFEGAQSLLQSGNVVFRSDEVSRTKLEARLEERLANDLHVPTDFFVRSAAEWESILAGNPFPREAREAPGYLIVTLLKDTPSPESWKKLDAAIRGPERVRGGGRHAYIVYPDGQGRSKLTLSLIEKNLGTRGTSRNWNTVTKLGILASGS